MLILIVGNIGSGKTLLLTIFLKYSQYKNIVTKANYVVKGSELINVNDVINFELFDCTLGLDELGTIIDSRTNTQSQRFIDYFIAQSRKRKVDVIGTAQLGSMVDLRFRELVHKLIYAEKKEDCFKYTVYEGYIRRKVFNITFEKANPFFKEFDTNEIVYPIDLFAGRNVSIEDLQNVLTNSPTKKAFVQLAKRDYPYISLENLNATYDFLKRDMTKEVKRLLGMKDEKKPQEVKSIE